MSAVYLKHQLRKPTTLHHKLHEATGVAVSSQTVHNRLHDMRLCVRRPRKTPGLRPWHRGACERWARARDPKILQMRFCTNFLPEAEKLKFCVLQHYESK